PAKTYRFSLPPAEQIRREEREGDGVDRAGGGAQVRSLPGPLLLRQPPAPPRLPWSILVRCIS
uniref:Uncharacterized protein n=1 Tax=Aegilops tauschii subsp. strangulata TaxID=200361 RepID=A0A453E610_AEGTS